jgi:hypothetical protein
MYCFSNLLHCIIQYMMNKTQSHLLYIFIKQIRENNRSIPALKADTSTNSGTERVKTDICIDTNM